MPDDISTRLLQAGMVILVAVVVRFLLVFLIRRGTRLLLEKPPQENNQDLGTRARVLLAQATGFAQARRQQRLQTMAQLFRNVVDVVIVVVTVLTVLSIAGVPMTPVLASAGVGGIALGFGAQSLVKDYLSGIFMLLEDQFGVGDLIRVNGITGTVLSVSLRVTKIREPMGTVWYLRNGEILTLGNVSQGFSAANVDVPVAIDEDPGRVTAVLEDAVAGMDDEPEWSQVLLEDPDVLGINSMSGGTMTIRIMLRTAPNQQWGVMHEVRRRAQEAVSRAGIRGPILVGPTGPH